jgi:hypothetical protein
MVSQSTKTSLSILSSIIILIILILIFHKIYKSLTEEPTSTTTASSGDGASGIDVAGQFGGPGAATGELPWTYPDPDALTGMLNMLAGQLADMIAKKLRELAEKYEEEKLKRKLDEQLRADAEENVQRERQLKDDFDNRLREVDESRMKPFEEKLRTEQSKVLTEKGLTDADIRTKVAAAEETTRKTLEENLRTEQSKVLAEKGLTDDQTRQKIKDIVDKYVQNFEARFNKINDLTPAARDRLQRVNTSSYDIDRMVRGEPRRGQDGRIDETRPPYDGHAPSGQISTKAMSNFSQLQLYKIAKRDSPMARSILKAWFKLNNAYDNLADNAASRTLEKFAASRAGKALAGAFEAINDSLDWAQIAMTFTDAAFYKQFPDEGSLFTSSRMSGYTNFTLKNQYDVIGQYNSKIDRQNEDTSAYGYPFASVQFPLINGPLTQIDMNTPGFEGDVYYNQTRVEVEIDSVRDYLLRTLEPFKTSIRSSIDSYYGEGTSNAIAVDSTQSFVDYLKFYSPDFIGLTDRQRDQLYELAYSNVCLKYDGVVYVDYYPSTDPHRAGRKRFQCGFKSPTVCNQNTVRWYDELMKGKVIGGEYAEWYTYDELLAKSWTTSNILPVGTFQSYKTTGNVYANDQASVALGQQGACMVMNSTLYSICYSTTKEFQQNYKVDPVDGTGYDFTTHTCNFSPAYCQSLGTCFRRSTKTCELPSKDLEGASIVFGTGGPRDFIRQHGCTIEDGLGQTDPLKITRAGLGVIYDAVSRMENWGPGLKESLGNPVGGLMFATAVMSVAQQSNPKVTAKIPGFGKALGAAMITMLVLIAVESLAGVYEQRSAPVDDPLEYTIGGWRTAESVDIPSSSGKAVRPMTFLDGWVTKPILYHPPGQMNNPYTSVDAFPLKSGPSDPLGVRATRSMYSTQLSGSDLRNRLSTCLPDTQAVGRLKEAVKMGTNIASLGLTSIGNVAGIYAGSLTCPTQLTCYNNPPSGFPQFSMIRASSRAEANQITCIQPFPIMSSQQATGLVDAEIGPLAGPSTQWLTSNIWTAGVDPYTPTFPMESVTRGPESKNRWYYQLVYDKKRINRTTIWDDTKMSKYFDGTTINYIRQSTCQDDFFSGSTVDPRCFGYLQVGFSGYKFSPMTLMGTISNAVIPS